MLNDQQILKQLKQMPQPLKTELLHYMEYLISKHQQQGARPKRPQFGSAKANY